MRIDLNSISTQGLGAKELSGAANAKTNRLDQTGVESGDVTQLSTGLDALRTLGAKLATVPDVRQQKIDSLRETIGNGTYRMSPEGIADSMLAESTRTA